jgi:hypothetical protein
MARLYPTTPRAETIWPWFLNYLVQVNRRDPIGVAAREARDWALWLSVADARRPATRCLKHPLKYKADTIAERFGVPNEHHHRGPRSNPPPTGQGD